MSQPRSRPPCYHESSSNISSAERIPSPPPLPRQSTAVQSQMQQQQPVFNLPNIPHVTGHAGGPSISPFSPVDSHTDPPFPLLSTDAHTSASAACLDQLPDLSGLPALANAASSRRLSFAPTAGTHSPLDAATTETLERQPREASGYEWDERHHSLTHGSDGTACLSVEPDGDGYLGKSSCA